MKKSILILILAGLLTACVPTAGVTPDLDHGEEYLESSLNSVPFSENNTESESYAEADTQLSTECGISTTETTVTTAKNQSETVYTTTSVTDVQKEKNQYDPTEAQQEKADVIAENATDHMESSTECTEEKSDILIQTEPPQTAEITEVTITELTEYEEETEPPEYGMTDYEKALEVYNFMTANGSGTCVQYSYQTYEMCCQYDLECYFAWTENKLYGHVANVVRVDGVWYVLDTQAGCFLTENMCGFTEMKAISHLPTSSAVCDTNKKITKGSQMRVFFVGKEKICLKIKY